LVSQITHRSNSVTAMTTTKSYDYLNRLLSIANVPAAAGETPITYSYLYNDANQRLRRTDPDDSYWLYEYDPLGQLTSGKHYWQDHTPVAGQQFEYAYDDIGNRTGTKEGGDASGAGLRSATYGANNLNQYTNRTVPGAADITGVAHASASVTVNSLSTYRKDEYFWKELSLANTNAPVWTNVSIIASLTGTNQTNAGNLLHPKATESFLFDADGNQTSDSLWTNSWDGENRLIVTESGAGVPSGGKVRQTWTLDGQSRWVQRIIYSWNGSSYVTSATNRFVWDGKVLLAILDHTNGIAQSYLRGLDLSGSVQGAGGAGGVLAVNIPTNGIHSMAYDGNGNVAGLVSGSAGTASGRYAYDPFANTLEVSGSAAQANLIRFSTQIADEIAAELKYLYRGLKSPIGRWLSCDPLEKFSDVLVTSVKSSSGEHISPLDPDSAIPLSADSVRRALTCLYTFCSNEPQGRADVEGLLDWDNTWELLGDVVPVPDDPRHKNEYRSATVKTSKGNPIPLYWHPTRYWCHGFTFGGTAGQWANSSMAGASVKTILDDEWEPVCCGLADNGVAVFYNAGAISHSGIITKVAIKGPPPKFDEVASLLHSKWGPGGPLNISPFSVNAILQPDPLPVPRERLPRAFNGYGRYKCYVRKGQRAQGCCPLPGDHEL
jgi:YD repeat-containing protein